MENIILNNPTVEQQNEILIKHLGKIPDNYKYVSSGSIVISKNDALGELWINTINEVVGKTKDGSRECQSWKGEYNGGK